MSVSRPSGAACALAAVMCAFPAASRAQDVDLGKEVLGPSDGWAAADGGTTGGVGAAPNQVYVVRTRAELIAALNNGISTPTAPGVPSDEPKIIYVSGTIDLNVDDANQPLTCESYYRNGYTLQAFLDAYDPAVWGNVPPTGPLEDARVASRNEQQRRVRMRIGSNTTIVGLGPDATIVGAFFDIRTTTSTRVRNIIIRNLRFRDTYDCFPQWVPGDGWNSAYDSISIRNGTNIWIDHNTFENVDTAALAEYFGEPYEVHDGQVDITNDADLLTVSWNRFRDNDKGGSLVGSSDSTTSDRGRLRVTFHHNVYDNVGQRSPRVRYGQVHAFNNYYRVTDAGYSYTWGVGVEAAIVAQNNFFSVETPGITPDRFVRAFRSSGRPDGTIRITGTYVNGILPSNRVDVFRAYNDVNGPDLSDQVGWTPVWFEEVNGTPMVARVVRDQAGPFKPE